MSARFYSPLLALSLTLTVWAGPIHLKTRNLTAAGYPAVEALRTAARSPGHLLLQFAEAPRPAALRELQQRGARIVSSAPDGGITIFLARPVSLEGLGVQWAGPLLAEDKVSPLLSPGVAPVVVEFHPDVRPRRALALLRAVNAQLLKHPGLAPNHFLIAATQLVLAALAGYDEVAYIFPASPDLIRGAPVIACSGPLMSAGPVGQYVAVSAGWGGAGPDGIVELNYFFSRMSPKLPADGAESEIVHAFQEWAQYAKLRFLRGASETAGRTISIQFAEGAHGDDYPFEPRSLVLAHTFFPSPPNSEPIAGDMHLNGAQDWHIGSDFDLYSVALHEAGHALGLGHSDDPDSVMYPYYRFGAVLSDDDIAGVRGLYGGRDSPVTPAVPPLALVISSPTPDFSTSSSGVSVSGFARGGRGTIVVTWTTDQGAAGQAVGSSEWSIAGVPLAIGLNRITVRAVDGAGESASAAVAVTRQTRTDVPNTPKDPSAPVAPALTITSPGLTVVSTTLDAITIAGTASPSVTSVTWTNSTGPSGSARGAAAWVAAGIPLLVGTNTITILAADFAGNTAWRSITVVRD